MSNPPDDESPDPTHSRHTSTPISQGIRRYNVHAPCRRLPIHCPGLMLTHSMARVACSSYRDQAHPWCIPLRGNPVPMGSCQRNRDRQWNSLRCRARMACKTLWDSTHPDLSVQLTHQQHCRMPAPHHPRINCQGVRGQHFEVANSSAARVLGRPSYNTQVNRPLAVLHGPQCRARAPI